ncbi:hypothetical protein CLV48_10647 [Cecembia rubra]|uniref:Uncharacterized protein n=1 Tax=Cecembia rubra TaxID=1485585 RepID=A0A2P8E2W4_9BACT|nr:hypothetical protein CLV48_10647 [Cecembia rubra]
MIRLKDKFNFSIRANEIDFFDTYLIKSIGAGSFFPDWHQKPMVENAPTGNQET